MRKLGCNRSLKEIHGLQSRKESQEDGAFKSQETNDHTLGFMKGCGCLNCHSCAVAAALFFFFW